MASGTGSSPPFNGRGEAVETLRRRLDEVRRGTGRVTLLAGDTGVGKSTLVAGLVTEIRGRGIRTLIGRAPPLDDPPPFSLLSSAIESAKEDPTLRLDEDPLIGGGPMLIGFAPGLGEADFSAPVGIEGRLLDALGGTESRGARSLDELLTRIADRFLEFTRHGPTVLVLEDLQRADKPSLTAVQFFAKELEDRPLWILATSRPTASLSEAGRMRLEAFEGATHAEQVTLPPLTSGEAAAYLRELDPFRQFTSEEVTRLYSETGGNPYLLQQFEHANSPVGAPRDPDGPANSPVDGEGKAILDFAAVIGPLFPFDLLLRASEQNEEHLAEIVDHLVARGLLFERSGEFLEFPEDRVREETYNLLPERRRRLLHRRVGEALESVGAVDVSRVYALSRHFYVAHVASKSIKYNRAAAELAERALAPETAWDHYTRALESQRELSPEDPDAESALVLDLARVTEELGLLQDAEAIIRDFLDRGEGDAGLSPGHRATLELFLARVRADQGDNPAAARLAEKVLGSPGLEDQRLVQIGAHRQLGMTLYYVGRYAEALVHHQEELRLAEETHNALMVARAQVWLSANLAMLGQTQQAIAVGRDATAARDRLGSVRESAQAHLYLGDLLADARSTPAQRDEAIREYAEAIRFGEQAKDPRRIGYALYKTSELLREHGQDAGADEKAQRAIEIIARIGDPVGLSMSQKVRGQVAMDQGDFELADTRLTEAFLGLEGLKHELEAMEVVLRRAELAARRGDATTARQYIEELETKNLLTVRPDLAGEFEQLKHDLDEPRPNSA